MIRILITAGAKPFCADADFIQIREPALEARALARLTQAWLAATQSPGGPSAGFPGKPSGFRPAQGTPITPKILLNDRADIAIACGAAGVHLRDRSISPARIRQIAPADFTIAVACHNAEAVRRAADEGADYAILAPIFPPLSKPTATPPLGLDALHSIASKARIPVIALGGITTENAPGCIEAGAAGVAGITMFRS
jgi:thiamine-phosphate pyrophosphorylase